jgi:MoaA/NifB/PqqE/SkfB family radical SAM enzyme
MKPRFLTIGVTNRCNSRCTKCAVWRTEFPIEELPAEVWIETITKLHEWLGPFELNLSGGEPTLKEGIVEIIAHAASLGIEVVMPTNGLAISDDLARRIAAAGLSRVNFSIDGPGPVNDAIKGVPGATERVWQTLDVMRAERRDMDFHGICVLMKQNLPVANEFVEALKNDGRIGRVRFQALVQPLGEPIDLNWHHSGSIWPIDPEVIAAAIDGLIEKKRAGWWIDNSVAQLGLMKNYFLDPGSLADLKCMVGQEAFFMAPNGEVILCGQMTPVGNITVDSPKRIWESAQAELTREQIRQCRRTCHQLVNCCFVEESVET